jgi:tRNA (cmo5U34)-methyltransferase
MRKTAWQNADVAGKFLDERRAAIPYHEDQLATLLHLVRHFRPDPRLIMDLGCGDGLLARRLLAVYPHAHALLLDISEPMLARARAAMAGFEGRFELIQADMMNSIGTHIAGGSPDLVVSGYAIHHLPHERKRSLYAEIHTLLASDGLFVNIEHVASPTPGAEALWNALMIDHLTAHTGKPRPQVETEYLTRPDKADNILAPMDVQVTWLREIGFDHADCYFKWLELAVLAGVKPLQPAR